MDVSGSSSSTVKKDKSPVTIITIGMAGAGKTSFVQRINAYLHSLSPPSPPYILNLDPAVTRVPYEANIDIRDTVNYQEVMKQFVSDPFFFFSFPILVALDEPSPMKGII
jgi:GPN-loop GTPase